MPWIAATATALQANPQPVICLDTCELLGAVQCVPQRCVLQVEALSRIFASLVSKPDRVLLVVTELVLHEWGQNITGVQTKAEKFLAQVDHDSGLVHDAWAHLGRPLGSTASAHSGSALIPELTALAQGLINAACVLDREAVCVERALGRVFAKARPSQDGRIKDSIHLEHYLELSRQLRNARYSQRRVFVSGNASDFCENSASSHVHPTLAPELVSVGLEFFKDLRSAVGSLGI